MSTLTRGELLPWKTYLPVVMFGFFCNWMANRPNLFQPHVHDEEDDEDDDEEDDEDDGQSWRQFR